MLIAGFLLTLLLTFVVCSFIGKESPLAKKKPTWKRLVYWGGIFFTSLVFNMLLISNSPYSYKIYINIHDDGFHLLILLILSYLVIQLLSPSIFFKGLYHNIKRRLGKIKSSSGEVSDSAESSQQLDLSLGNSPSLENESSERGFEIFLNTLCWLSFTFTIIINSVYGFMPDIFSIQNSFLKFEAIQAQLHHISSIMILFTLPISFRQILFYLSKLRKPSRETKEAVERSSSMYERYVMAQRRLKRSNRKL